MWLRVVLTLGEQTMPRGKKPKVKMRGCPKQGTLLRVMIRRMSGTKLQHFGVYILVAPSFGNYQLFRLCLIAEALTAL